MLSALAAGLHFSSTVMVPLMLLLLLGALLRRLGMLENATLAGMNQLVYRCALPALLFFSVLRGSGQTTAAAPLLMASFAAVLLLFALATPLAKRFFRPVERGVFVQGVYRSNMAIVGLAIIARLYDEEVLAMAALCVGATAVLLSVLAVICLSWHSGQAQRWPQQLRAMLLNPLIMALLLALLFRALDWRPPLMMAHFGDYLAQLTLPLALLCAGASFDLRRLSASPMAIYASLGKSLLAPAVFVACGYALGLEGSALGVLFILGGAPAANAGYIMARAIPGNDVVAAANILLLSMLFSMLSLTLGIAAFASLGWL